MSITRLDLRRELRHLYTARTEPALLEVPELSFLMVDGSGDPNTDPAFGDAIATLYPVAFTLKFTVKQRPEDAVDYPVMPLEALWWNTPEQTLDLSAGSKSQWSWTAMILVPDLVTPEMVSDALEAAAARRALPAAGRLRLEHFEEGESAQVMHIGPYDAEAPTIQRLHAFIASSGAAPRGRHHEIYLGDPRRAAPEKLRTIVRQPVSR
jgi:hypothetical protein